MKIKTVKALSAMLTLIMALGLSACGKEQQKADDTETVAATQQDELTQGDAAAALPIVKDKLTLKFVCYNWGDVAYGNDMPVFQELEKRTNIHLEWQLLPAEDNLTKLNLIMASGDLPDIVSFSDDSQSKKTFDKYAADGAIIPLDELIEENAPNIKALLETPPFEIPNLKAEIKDSNGKIICLPAIAQIHTGQIFSIRQDWLDKVDMKVPETTDDLYNVLKAFKNTDLNGNATADEIAFTPDEGLTDLTILMNAFGAHESFYVDQNDGSIKYGPIEDRYREGLEYCNKLFNEGLIDKNYISINGDDFRAKISKNLVGMFYAWPMSGLGFANTAIAAVDPNAKYVAMLPVKGPHGDRFKERPQTMVSPRTVITSANKHKDETMRYLDYLYSTEGNILMNYGVEEKHYTMDSNGNPVFTDHVLKNAEGKDPATVRITDGMQVGLPFISTLECELQAATNDAVKEAWKIYTDNDVLFPNFPNVQLNEAQIGEISGLITDIKTYVDENSNNFIMGKQSLNGFNNFVETIKDMGIDSVLSIYNEAYKKYAELNQ